MSINLVQVNSQHQARKCMDPTRYPTELQHHPAVNLGRQVQSVENHYELVGPISVEEGIRNTQF